MGGLRQFPRLHESGQCAGVVRRPGRVLPSPSCIWLRVLCFSSELVQRGRRNGVLLMLSEQVFLWHPCGEVAKMNA